jgi:outer membrane lipoprotein-sorting protein
MRVVNLLILILLLGCFELEGQITSTDQLLDAMQTKHRGAWFKNFTFAQQTIRFKQDGSVRDTAVWNEAVQYPDFFRIDYNENGRFIIFRNDSSFRFENFEFQRSGVEPQEFLLFKGGLYFQPASSILQKLKKYGYDTSIFREDYLNGKRAYVVGAQKGDLSAKQFWVDADNFYTLRRVSKLSGERVLDVQYRDHVKIEGGWVEQAVLFYLDGRKIQIENYFDIKIHNTLNENIFDPNDPDKYWYKK